MKRGHDLSGVMKFATSPAWGEHLGEALGDHLGLAMEEFDFEADELADIVGDHWAGVLWGCAFEDLLTRTIQPDRNIVDDYIRRRGWNESGPTKIYLRALRSSVMSLRGLESKAEATGYRIPIFGRVIDGEHIRKVAAMPFFFCLERVTPRLIDGSTPMDHAQTGNHLIAIVDSFDAEASVTVPLCLSIDGILV